MKKTNAARILERLEITYELTPYHYEADDLSVPQIAETNGLAVEQIFKTLVAKGDKTGVLVAVVRGDHDLEFKSLARASGNKKITLVPVKELPALTGYIRGGCCPLGMKKAYPVYIDEAAREQDVVYVNAGQRGLFLKLHPKDLVRAASAKMVAIAQQQVH